MGDPRGFLKVARKEEGSREQASRCMDCGTPFCHSACPLGNYIPEWNDLMFNDHWQRAFDLLNASNNLPEVTSRLCPALCEQSCLLGINDDPVTVKQNELAIIEYAFKKKLIKANPPKIRTGRKVAVIGSGPAGLACAAELNQKGHEVTLFEKDDKIGGIMRYGIPDFKLEKKILDRRIAIWKKEGIKFELNSLIKDKHDLKGFDAICLASGCRTPRDLKILGRDLKGIHFAMDYLIQSNRRLAGQKITKKDLIDAKGKKVLVIGGGDTGSDCVGTANLQGATSVFQVEVMPKPLVCQEKKDVDRRWEVFTKEFVGKKGKVKKAKCQDKACQKFEIEADLVILAIGFTGPEPHGFDLKQKDIFVAGDMNRGPSLIVWAIHEGRQIAKMIDQYLKETK